MAVLLASCSEKSESGDNADLDTSVSPVPAAGSTGASFKILSEKERAELEERERAFDPKNDGWSSEAFHEETQDRLRELAAAISSSESPASLLDEGAVVGGGGLRPEKLAPVLDNRGLQILRADGSGVGETDDEGTLEEELQALAASLHEGGADVSVRFKQYRVSPPAEGEREGSSKVLFKAKASGAETERVQRATWTIDWVRGGDGSFLIRRIVSADYEEIILTKSEDDPEATKKTLFRDRTEDLLGRDPRVGKLIQYGANELSVRSIFESGRALIGIAVGDANGDGLDDVYAPQAKGVPNVYLLSQPDGTHAEVAARVGLDWLDPTAVALFADFDNDGDQDLVAATRELLTVLENEDGTGLSYRRVKDFPQEDTTSLCAADYDGDGLLDLYVCNYLESAEREVLAMPDAIYNARHGGSNRLYRNTGDLAFVDVTAMTGMDTEARRLSLAAAWEDFDNDGDPDLYVANDFGRNCLYRNDGGSFTEIAAEVGADDPSTGMSVTWGDIDRDGLMDTCVGNMFSSAGHRVTVQPKFLQELTKGLDPERIQYLARGNTLLMNRTGGTFAERSAQAGVINTQWTWSTLFADFDNNGHLDMAAVNGYVTGPEVDDL